MIPIRRGAATRAGPARPPLGRLDFGGAPESILRNPQRFAPLRQNRAEVGRPNIQSFPGLSEALSAAEL